MAVNESADATDAVAVVIEEPKAVETVAEVDDDNDDDDDIKKRTGGSLCNNRWP